MFVSLVQDGLWLWSFLPSSRSAFLPRCRAVVNDQQHHTVTGRRPSPDHHDEANWRGGTTPAVQLLVGEHLS